MDENPYGPQEVHLETAHRKTNQRTVLRLVPAGIFLVFGSYLLLMLGFIAAKHGVGRHPPIEIVGIIATGCAWIGASVLFFRGSYSIGLTIALVASFATGLFF